MIPNCRMIAAANSWRLGYAQPHHSHFPPLSLVASTNDRPNRLLYTTISCTSLDDISISSSLIRLYLSWHTFDQLVMPFKRKRITSPPRVRGGNSSSSPTPLLFSTTMSAASYGGCDSVEPLAPTSLFSTSDVDSNDGGRVASSPSTPQWQRQPLAPKSPIACLETHPLTIKSYSWFATYFCIVLENDQNPQQNLIVCISNWLCNG